MICVMILDLPAPKKRSKTRAGSTGVCTAGHWIAIETNEAAFTSGTDCVVLALL